MRNMCKQACIWFIGILLFVVWRPAVGQDVAAVNWTDSTGILRLKQLSAYLSAAPYFGLLAGDYDAEQIADFAANGLEDTTQNERITSIAVRFFTDVAYGKLDKAPVRSNVPGYSPVYRDSVVKKLHTSITASNFSGILQSMEPAGEGYEALKATIRVLHDKVKDSSFADIELPLALTDTADLRLVTRFWQLGISESPLDIYQNVPVRQQIRSAQHRFGLPENGNLNKILISALNVPVSERLQALNRAINQYRWMYYSYRETAAVIVNIPSNQLFVFQKDSCIFNTKVITGKPSTPTPTLCSSIYEIILYPYWTVPHKIASRELLPHIKKDRGYLEANQFQVLDKSGHVIDAGQIDWARLSASNFPYTLRQNTGCDNSLGIIKLNFESPFGVYLHDTPWKLLFLLQQRYYSHGCVRVEDAVTLALMLAEEKSPYIQELIGKGEQPGQKPVPVKLNHPPLVFILYNTAWFDESMNVRFYPDIYKRD